VGLGLRGAGEIRGGMHEARANRGNYARGAGEGRELCTGRRRIGGRNAWGAGDRGRAMPGGNRGKLCISGMSI
jgi:hypothetical protein